MNLNKLTPRVKRLGTLQGSFKRKINRDKSFEGRWSIRRQCRAFDVGWPVVRGAIVMV